MAFTAFVLAVSGRAVDLSGVALPDFIATKWKARQSNELFHE